MTQSIRVVVQEAKYGRLVSINTVSKKELLSERRPASPFPSLNNVANNNAPGIKSVLITGSVVSKALGVAASANEGHCKLLATACGNPLGAY